MVKNNITKKFLGTANYMARLTFYPNRKHYSAAMKVKIEIFDGRNLDGDFDCTNIAEVAEKVMKFYLEKTGHDIEIRRLARWFIEYLNEADITEPEMSDLLRDLQSTPQEILSREGIDTSDIIITKKEVEEEDDDDEDELEEAVEEVAEEIEEAEENLTEDEIIEEVIEEVVEENIEDTVEETIDEEEIDDDIIEDIIEEIAEETIEEETEE